MATTYTKKAYTVTFYIHGASGKTTLEVTDTEENNFAASAALAQFKAEETVKVEGEGTYLIPYHAIALVNFEETDPIEITKGDDDFCKPVTC